ncbi:MAG: hypothetical protein IKB27_02085 [Clostridia bacterium]|nr:hypothetical protein [Clostridia bacterium]
MNAQEKYKGKRFSVLGDSISTLDGYSQPPFSSYYDNDKKRQANIFMPQDTWWGQVIEHLGGELLVNNSISGSMACKHKQCLVPTFGCSDERTSALCKDGVCPDVIMVYLGTNDWGFGMKPTPNRKEYENDLSVFSVAYSLMLDKLQKNYPQAEIWCFTLCASGSLAGEKREFFFYPGGYHMKDYCHVIEQCAKNHACRVIDLYNNVIPFDTIDGFHPNFIGMKAIADGIITSL